MVTETHIDDIKCALILSAARYCHAPQIPSSNFNAPVDDDGFPMDEPVDDQDCYTYRSGPLEVVSANEIPTGGFMAQVDALAHSLNFRFAERERRQLNHKRLAALWETSRSVKVAAPIVQPLDPAARRSRRDQAVLISSINLPHQCVGDNPLVAVSVESNSAAGSDARLPLVAEGTGAETGTSANLWNPILSQPAQDGACQHTTSWKESHSPTFRELTLLSDTSSPEHSQDEEHAREFTTPTNTLQTLKRCPVPLELPVQHSTMPSPREEGQHELASPTNTNNSDDNTSLILTGKRKRKRKSRAFFDDDEQDAVAPSRRAAKASRRVLAV